MRGASRTIGVVASAAIVSACSQASEPIVCPDLFRSNLYGVNLIVRDAAGVPAARGVTAIAREGAYFDSVTVPSASFDDFIIGLVADRPGTYDVTVRKAGYNDWLKSGVVVRADGCGIRADTLIAKLQPAPPRS